jgi:hypothetical protein
MFAKDVEVIAEEEFIHRWWYKYTTTPCTPSFKRRGKEALLPTFHQTGIIRKL